MIDVIDDEAFGGVHDETVHIEVFSLVLGNGVRGVETAEGPPSVFGEFVVVGGVDDGELALCERDEACSGIEGSRRLEIVAAVRRCGGSIGLFAGGRVIADEDSIRQADDGIAESAKLTSFLPPLSPPPGADSINCPSTLARTCAYCAKIGNFSWGQNR